MHIVRAFGKYGDDRSKWKTRTNLSTSCWKLLNASSDKRAFCCWRAKWANRIQIENHFVTQMNMGMNGWTQKKHDEYAMLWRKYYSVFLPFLFPTVFFNANPFYTVCAWKAHALHVNRFILVVWCVLCCYYVTPFLSTKMPVKWKYSNWLYFYWLIFPLEFLQMLETISLTE